MMLAQDHDDHLIIQHHNNHLVVRHFPTQVNNRQRLVLIHLPNHYETRWKKKKRFKFSQSISNERKRKKSILTLVDRMKNVQWKHSNVLYRECQAYRLAVHHHFHSLTIHDALFYFERSKFFFFVGCFFKGFFLLSSIHHCMDAVCAINDTMQVFFFIFFCFTIFFFSFVLVWWQSVSEKWDNENKIEKETQLQMPK